MNASDSELLRRYCDDGSESAFTELVQRHINLVYATALRQAARDEHCAKDISQAVFSALAAKSRQLQAHRSLGGWLYTTTLYVAGKTIRSEQRRRTREQEASAM